MPLLIKPSLWPVLAVNQLHSQTIPDQTQPETESMQNCIADVKSWNTTTTATTADHVQPILQSLHWLPVRARIQHKVFTICFNAITQCKLYVTGAGSQEYLSEPLHPCTPSRDLRSSANTRLLKLLHSSCEIPGPRFFFTSRSLCGEWCSLGSSPSSVSDIVLTSF